MNSYTVPVPKELVTLIGAGCSLATQGRDIHTIGVQGPGPLRTLSSMDRTLRRNCVAGFARSDDWDVYHLGLIKASRA